MNKEQIIDILKFEIAKIVQRDVDSIDEGERLLKMGVSSIQAIKIINQIRKRLEVDINPVALFEYKTINEFSEYLVTLKNESELVGSRDNE